ncbi:MAG: alkaline shock response membrane anchor protein AmaP [Verrucomicrobia bacterium]|nr:alkaline shock response membrane anchor protein AmaP [Verrucomicrobiota bacterium]MBU4290020.1 alkaline shock response membrane anchor protein AmaP [Verrucomicrobiota bacterium]MBU4430080.1 alkaline shock response membrane anchor protein AmaP [Verrucomicrobiota bacterium]MCG2679609.1 alkaline shock response membrane anchor protein AmaP [Kiritimatiellia bacterium]
MKILHGLIGFALSVAILGLGWVLVAGVFGIHYAYWDVLLSSRVWQFVLGVSLITLVALFWLSALPLGAREQYLSFDSEGGMVSISVNAVNTFLAKLKTEFAGVVDLQADVSASRDGTIEVRLDMTVKAGTHIQQLSQALQQRVRDSMRESLGIAEVASVKVNVQDIVAVADNAETPPPQASEWQDNG